MMLIFHLGRADVLPVDDYAVRKTVGEIYRLGETPAPQVVQAIGERWRPYRTVASLYMYQIINAKAVKDA